MMKRNICLWQNTETNLILNFYKIKDGKLINCPTLNCNFKSRQHIIISTNWYIHILYVACPVFVYDYGVVADVELGTLSGCAFFVYGRKEGELLKIILVFVFLLILGAVSEGSKNDQGCTGCSIIIGAVIILISMFV